VELNKKSLKKRLEKIDFLSKKHIIAKNKEVENQPLFFCYKLLKFFLACDIINIMIYLGGMKLCLLQKI